MNDRSELALQDYDHLPEGSLAHRIRSLTVEELAQVLDYEREHANRLSVVQLLSERIKQVESGASLSSGTSSEERPEQAESPAGGSQVHPASGSQPAPPRRHGVADQTPKRGRS